MAATFPVNDPVPELMDQLIDALYLLNECRRRGVQDTERLLDYIEHTIDEIERYRLGMPRELFDAMVSYVEADGVLAC